MGTSPFSTLHGFCHKFSLDGQAATVLIKLGLLPCHEEAAGKRKRIIMDVENFPLEEGTHYIACSSCGKKMLSLISNHTKKCAGLNLDDFLMKYPEQQVFSKLATERKIKTEKQKLAQSEKLKKRFQTMAGEETRRQLPESTRTPTRHEQRRRSRQSYGCPPPSREKRFLRGLKRCGLTQLSWKTCVCTG